MRRLAQPRFPLAQAAPDVGRFEIEHRTDRHERTEPVRVVAKEPLARFLEERSPFPARHVDIFLITANAVFENREQQSPLRFERQLAPEIRGIILTQ